jgi:hypothetical protein
VTTRPAEVGSSTKAPDGSITCAWMVLNGGRRHMTEKSASMQCMPRLFQPTTV